MSTQQDRNKQLIRQLIDNALNRGNFKIVDELLAHDLEEHDPHQAVMATPRQAFTSAVNAFRIAVPDQNTVVDEQIAEHNLVATRWHMTGTHKGTFMGAAPTGRRVEVTGIFFDRLENGRIVETWANYDLFGLMQQIS